MGNEMDRNELEAKLNELARRLDRIECHLGMDEKIEPGGEPESTATLEPTPIEEQKLPTPERDAQPLSPTKPIDEPHGDVIDEKPRDEIPTLRPAAARINESTMPEETREAILAKTESAKTKPSPSNAGLEFALGTKWIGWAGAIVVILAVGFFVKMAYDWGWFQMPPEVKCIGIGVFGLALIGGGEWALRKINRAAAVGLFAAGLGTLYMVSFAASSPEMFDVISKTVGLNLLAAVSFLGFLITLRAKMLSIGVVSLIGGYLSPILLGERADSPLPLAIYITALLAIGLGLSAWKPSPFRALRYVSLACHSLLAAAWLVDVNQNEWPIVGMVFVSIWWAMFLAEIIWAALRDQSAIGNAIVSLFGTLIYVVGGCWILAEHAPDQMALLAVIAAGICTGIAFFFGPGLAALNKSPVHAIEKLAVTLWGQAGILLAVAVAMYFKDFGQTVAWLAMAVICVEVGRRLPSAGVQVFGMLVGTLSIVRVATNDINNPVLQTVLYSNSQLSVTWWSVLALTVIIAVQFVAMRVRLSEKRKGSALPTVISIIGTLGWFILAAMQFKDLSITHAWLIGPVAMLAFAQFGKRQHFIGQAFGFLLLTAGKWMLVDVAMARVFWSRVSNSLPFANLQLATGLAIACVFWWAHIVQKQRANNDKRSSWAIGFSPSIAILVAVFGLSYEIDHLVEMWRVNGHVFVWPTLQVKCFGLIILWSAIGAALQLCNKLLPHKAISSWGMRLPFLAAALWATAGTLAPRINDGVVNSGVILNLQFLAGFLTAGVLLLTYWLSRCTQPTSDDKGWIATTAMSFCLAIVLLLGSLEIDRYFATSSHTFADAGMARQAGLSIYWGVFGIALVIGGFWRRSAAARRVGLVMLIGTLIKVLAYDMRQVDNVYRVLSLLGTGMLLLGTSVFYNKLSVRLEKNKQ